MNKQNLLSEALHRLILTKPYRIDFPKNVPYVKIDPLPVTLIIKGNKGILEISKDERVFQLPERFVTTIQITASSSFMSNSISLYTFGDSMKEIVPIISPSYGVLVNLNTITTKFRSRYLIFVAESEKVDVQVLLSFKQEEKIWPYKDDITQYCLFEGKRYCYTKSNLYSVVPVNHSFIDIISPNYIKEKLSIDKIIKDKTLPYPYHDTINNYNLVTIFDNNVDLINDSGTLKSTFSTGIYDDGYGKYYGIPLRGIGGNIHISIKITIQAETHISYLLGLYHSNKTLNFLVCDDINNKDCEISMSSDKLNECSFVLPGNVYDGVRIIIDLINFDSNNNDLHRKSCHLTMAYT